MIRNKLQYARARGFSMIGILVTMVIMVVLFSILMTSLNKRVTGQGTQQAGTLRSFEDELYLMSIYQTMAAHALENRGRYLVPSELSRSDDPSLNTTANLFSAMVMHYHVPTKQLISGNEYSGYVEEKFDYDMSAYDPARNVFWDPTFQADLQQLSNVSFAHMPLCGERFRRQWKNTMDSSFPLLGNRGPKDGVSSINSFACGRDGIWRGHIVFGDGHIAFVENPTLASSRSDIPGGEADNVFKMESGASGDDAILSFTQSMSDDGPVLQWD